MSYTCVSVNTSKWDKEKEHGYEIDCSKDASYYRKLGDRCPF